MPHFQGAVSVRGEWEGDIPWLLPVPEAEKLVRALLGKDGRRGNDGSGLGEAGKTALGEAVERLIIEGIRTLGLETGMRITVAGTGALAEIGPPDRFSDDSSGADWDSNDDSNSDANGDSPGGPIGGSAPAGSVFDSPIEPFSDSAKNRCSLWIRLQFPGGASAALQLILPSWAAGGVDGDPDEAGKESRIQVFPVEYRPLGEQAEQAAPAGNIDLLWDVPLQVTVELGRTRKQLREVMGLGPGSIVELDRLAGEAVDVLVNGKIVARGEVVVIDENFGVRITEILSSKRQLEQVL
ncbi:MAG: flagellar motor switch protein FliN [Firmicutes bacterium]|nr:flagellar motor switch protein FliN [Bacillota bacterium]